MLIPSIDLMGGKIVQLVHGERKILEFDNFAHWVERFQNYPIVQLIDLDAAMGKGNNRELLAYFAQQMPCQVGGGIRTVEDAELILKLGARKIIIGSSLVREGEIDVSFAAGLESKLCREKLIFAIDSRRGKVATHGWQTRTGISPLEMVQRLESYCDAFLYTHIDTEGMMRGFPLEQARQLRATTKRRLIVAGGITTHDEIARLESMAIDAVVGMAIYTSTLSA
ncbi:MAG TPA: HisA/HisF-related TIM barrel protein [Verrucomicrobiae bacterium]|nr:HisA/HisF-related TIM barrel protein [Verrucomicrobiae bacterium]